MAQMKPTSSGIWMVLLMAATLLPTTANAAVGIILGVFIVGGGAVMLFALNKRTSIDRSVPEEKLKLAKKPERGLLVTTMSEDDTCRLLTTLARQAGCAVIQNDETPWEFDVTREVPSGEEFRCRLNILAHDSRTYIRYQSAASRLSQHELEREAQHLLGVFIDWLPEGRVVESANDFELMANNAKESNKRIETSSIQSNSGQEDTQDEM